VVPVTLQSVDVDWPTRHSIHDRFVGAVSGRCPRSAWHHGVSAPLPALCRRPLARSRLDLRRVWLSGFELRTTDAWNAILPQEALCPHHSV